MTLVPRSQAPRLIILAVIVGAVALSQLAWRWRRMKAWLS